jgi:hypothetical protein
MRSWMAVAVLLAVAPESLPAAAPRPRQYQIDLVIKSGDPSGSVQAGTQKLLASPRLITLEKQPANFISGGQVLVRGEFEDFGLIVRCVVEPGLGRRINMKVVLERIEVVQQRGERVTLQTSKVTHDLTFSRGEAIKLRFSRGNQPYTWVEVSVREVVP